MDSQMTSFISASQEEENMEPLDLSVHSNKRHSEEPGTFQERPLCLIKSCGCQNGSLHPRIPLMHHEHQISCTAMAAADGYLWRIEDPTKQLQPAPETTTMIPCHTRDLPSREDHLQHQYLLLNRPQSCPITTSAGKWPRFHGLPQNNPGAESLQESRGCGDQRMPKDRWDQMKESVSTPDDKYSKKTVPNDLSKSTQHTKLSTQLKESDDMEEVEEEEEENDEPTKAESPSLSKTPSIPQWAPLSPTSSVNREPENYLNLMHHLLQGCATVTTDTSVTTRNHHDSGSNHGSAGHRDSDHSETGVRDKDNESPMDQDSDDSSSHQANDGVSASKDTASSNGAKDEGMEEETSENTNNSTDDSSAKKSPATELKAAKVTKVNALDYLISKYLVQNVDVPYKPCNRKIRELLNNGETKICFMDLIELQIEKSFTVPG